MHQAFQKIFYEIRTPKFSWNDIGGYSKLKKVLIKKVDTNKTLFFWGPKGIGIPMLAEAFAKEKNTSFIFFCVHKLFDVQNIHKEDCFEEIFQLAKAEAPVVLFISDLEWIIPYQKANYEWEPGNTRGKPWTFATHKFSEEFYIFLKKIITTENIHIIGASYRIDTVDPYVLKLFTHKIFVPPPEQEDRREIFEICIEKAGIKNKISNEVDTEWLAEISPGFGGNDIQNVCKQVLVQAVKHNVNILTPSLFRLVLKNYTPYLTKTMIETYFKLAEREW